MTRTSGLVGSPAPDPTPARQAYAYRTAFLAGITPEDVQGIGAALLERAKAGDVQAARLILDRFLGNTPVAEWPSARALEFSDMLG